MKSIPSSTFSLSEQASRQVIHADSSAKLLTTRFFEAFLGLSDQVPRSTSYPNLPIFFPSSPHSVSGTTCTDTCRMKIHH